MLRFIGFMDLAFSVAGGLGFRRASLKVKSKML